MQALSPSNMGLDPGDQGDRAVVTAPTQPASVETSIVRPRGRSAGSGDAAAGAGRTWPSTPRLEGSGPRVRAGSDGTGPEPARSSRSRCTRSARVRADHDPARRDPLQGLGDVLAEVTKARSAATGAGRRPGWTTRSRGRCSAEAGGRACAARKPHRRALRARRPPALGSRPASPQILQDEFELGDPGAALRGGPEPFSPQPATSSFSRSTAISEASRAARSARIMAWAAARSVGSGGLGRVRHA